LFLLLVPKDLARRTGSNNKNKKRRQVSLLLPLYFGLFALKSHMRLPLSQPRLYFFLNFLLFSRANTVQGLVEFAKLNNLR